MKRAIKIDGRDNVAVAVEDMDQGEECAPEGRAFAVLQTVPRGHKIALRLIQAGEPIVKYGVPIGRARGQIRMGEHVHVHNVEDITEELCRHYAQRFRAGKGE